MCAGRSHLQSVNSTCILHRAGTPVFLNDVTPWPCHLCCLPGSHPDALGRQAASFAFWSQRVPPVLSQVLYSRSKFCPLFSHKVTVVPSGSLTWLGSPRPTASSQPLSFPAPAPAATVSRSPPLSRAPRRREMAHPTSGFPLIASPAAVLRSDSFHRHPAKISRAPTAGGVFHFFPASSTVPRSFQRCYTK